MEYRPLGQTGLEVSSIGLGCVTFGREIDKATSFDVLDHALERGINLLDTAEATRLASPSGSSASGWPIVGCGTASCWRRRSQAR
ncbi:MAG: hypothetical protein CM1200mP2_25980 [Planctomycetaceae bacterium]|nr:MAG: hypothetical protein CM1200mP2_25980 [Planctomycetaceae bacterium]